MDARADASNAGERMESPASDAPIVVTLVHGTFAKGAPWTKEGSILRKQVAAALGEHGREMRFDVFDWSGRNTHKARVKAGYELANHIRDLRTSCANCRHFIIAHSHGGNVALLAHKHLEPSHHATGIATLGTPFIQAQVSDALLGATDASLRADSKEGIAIGAFAWGSSLVMSMLAAVTIYPYLQWWTDWSAVIAIAIVLALWGALFESLRKGLAWLLYPIGAKRAAARLGSALTLKPMPHTHIISFVYPGDEAGMLLNALEKTTSLPTRAIAWFKNVGGFIAGVATIIFMVTAFFSEPIIWMMGTTEERLKDVASRSLTGILMAGLGVWMLLAGLRYLLSFLRGHPAGFGWERPSIHAHIDIGVGPTAVVPAAKSNTLQEVPFTAEDDARKGLRHSGLYEDNRILKALAYWMANVK